MSVKTDIKYNNAVIDSLTSSGSIDYATTNKYLEHTLSIEFTGTEDATVTSNKMLSGYTAYGADGNKATGTIPTWNGEIALPDYLCFTANTAGSTVSLKKFGSPSSSIEYSTDGIEWLDLDVYSTTVTLTNVGDKIYLKGNNPTGLNADGNCLQFVLTGSIAASGNIMSLIDDGRCNTLEIPCEYCFMQLFGECTALTSAPTLPATSLTKGCYSWMFYYCTHLAQTPSLPAEIMQENCYEHMFNSCLALVTPPQLPATILAQYCYLQMFVGCSSLIVSDTSMESAEVQWIIPKNGNGVGDFSMGYMFREVSGTRSTNSPNFNGIQKIYYTQNPPV